MEEQLELLSITEHPDIMTAFHIVCAILIVLTIYPVFIYGKAHRAMWRYMKFKIVTCKFINKYRVGMDTLGYSGEDLLNYLLLSPLLNHNKIWTLFLWQFKEVNDKYSQDVFQFNYLKEYYRELSLYYPPRGDKYKTVKQIADEYEKSQLMKEGEVNNEMMKFLQEHISVSSNKVESKAVCQLFNALTGLNMYYKPPHVFVKKYLPEHFPTLAFTSYSAIIAMNSASKSKKDSADVQLLMSRIQNAVERQVESPENG